MKTVDSNLNHIGMMHMLRLQYVPVAQGKLGTVSGGSATEEPAYPPLGEAVDSRGRAELRRFRAPVLFGGEVPTQGSVADLLTPSPSNERLTVSCC